MRLETEVVYEKEGTVTESATNAMIALIVGVGIAILVLIFVGVLGGQVYVQVEPDINNITDTTIQGYIKDAITSGFKALKLTGSYMPIVVLAGIIFLVLVLVIGALRTAGMQATTGYGGVL